MDLSLGHQHEQVIYLDEDVFVVLGNITTPATTRSAWAPTGSYGPIPEDACIGSLAEVLDSIGLELWEAKRRGREACLVKKLATYDLCTVLSWGADCVEHFARRAQAVDGNVVETLALARRCARERQFQAADAARLAGEADQVLHKLRNGGLWAFGRALTSRAVGLGFGWFGPSEEQYEAQEYATADLRAMQVALMHATKELCDPDPLVAGREAAKWCRRSSARRAIAQAAGDRSNKANESSFLNLLLNPFASGTFKMSLPDQISAVQEGDDPERQWQAMRLREYLTRTDDEPLGSPAPW